MSKSCSLKSPAQPCPACPWRRDSVAADIPNFSLERAEGLAECSPDEHNIGPHFGANMFACHQSKEGAEFPCAGWLAVVGHCHPQVRIAIRENRLNPAALKPGKGWPALHSNYPEVLEKLRATTPTTGTGKKMKFGQTEIPGSLFKLARERMLRDATFTPGDIRAHLAKEAPSELAAISGIGRNWGIIADRVTRACIDQLRAAGEIGQLKRGVWAKTSFLAATNT